VQKFVIHTRKSDSVVVWAALGVWTDRIKHLHEYAMEVGFPDSVLRTRLDVLTLTLDPETLEYGDDDAKGYWGSVYLEVRATCAFVCLEWGGWGYY
jgi:hypothetical protein